MKQHIQLFEDFVNEGGWATTKTQGTSITPDVIGAVVKKMEEIAKGFSGHLAEIGLPPLNFVRPIGSGTWWKDDVENQPDKTYGDVDYLVGYPTLKLTAGKDREDELASTKLYNSELLMWLEYEKINGVDLPESKKISSPDSLKLIVETPLKDGSTGYVQVDLVVTPQEYTQWTLFRMTPIRNIKGFVLGNLYSSFGEVLDISIQARGVRAKFEGQVMTPYSKRAGVEEKLLTSNIQTFMHDIARFFWETSGTDKPYEEAPSLKRWKGINPQSPRFEDLCDGIRGVAETLEQLGEFGSVIKYKSAKELLEAVKKRYIEKMETAGNAEKLNKAATPSAIAAAEKLRKFVKDYTDLANKLL